MIWAWGGGIECYGNVWKQLINSFISFGSVIESIVLFSPTKRSLKGSSRISKGAVMILAPLVSPTAASGSPFFNLPLWVLLPDVFAHNSICPIGSPRTRFAGLVPQNSIYKK